MTNDRRPFITRLQIAAMMTALCLSAAAHAAKTCDARKYGAKADGTTNDTRALQSAIDACAARGGKVVLAGGTFLSGPLVLKSNVDLDVAAGATLLGSSNHDDYPEISEFRNPGRQSLLSAKDAENISITGGGTIDGAGQSWWAEARSHRDHGVMGEASVFRPRLIVFDHCKHVLMEGVTVQNSPSWQIVPYYTDDVTIRNIKVLADPHSPNTDAIDPFSSSHVRIDHVYADVGDDNIAIKSGAINSPGPDSPSTDITITDCTFMHGHGLSIGSEIAGGAQNITATNIHFDGTDQGIRIKANRDRGNDVSHIVFRNLDMKDVKTAIMISEYYPRVLPPPDDKPEPVGRLTPHFHDITIENVKATVIKVAGVVIGLPEAPVTDVVLNNVSIQAQTGMTISNATVTAHNLNIVPASGQPVTLLENGKLDRN
ncbi:MAG: glycoside hydrolase family 28 protein [Acidobacteriaceae bacterium]